MDCAAAGGDPAEVTVWARTEDMPKYAAVIEQHDVPAMEADPRGLSTTRFQVQPLAEEPYRKRRTFLPPLFNAEPRPDEGRGFAFCTVVATFLRPPPPRRFSSSRLRVVWTKRNPSVSAFHVPNSLRLSAENVICLTTRLRSSPKRNPYRTRGRPGWTGRLNIPMRRQFTRFVDSVSIASTSMTRSSR